MGAAPKLPDPIRRSVLVLRIVAGGLVGFTLISALITNATQDDYFGQSGEDFSFWYSLGQILQQMTYNIGIAGLVLAASVMVEVMGLRMAHERLAPSGGERSAPADPGGTLAVNIPPRPLMPSSSRSTPAAGAATADESIWMPPGASPEATRLL
jgi:hypothetical protein